MSADSNAVLEGSLFCFWWFPAFARSGPDLLAFYVCFFERYVCFLWLVLLHFLNECCCSVSYAGCFWSDMQAMLLLRFQFSLCMKIVGARSALPERGSVQVCGLLGEA